MTAADSDVLSEEPATFGHFNVAFDAGLTREANVVARMVRREPEAELLLFIRLADLPLNLDGTGAARARATAVQLLHFAVVHGEASLFQHVAQQLALLAFNLFALIGYSWHGRPNGTRPTHKESV